MGARFSADQCRRRSYRYVFEVTEKKSALRGKTFKYIQFSRKRNAAQTRRGPYGNSPFSRSFQEGTVSEPVLYFPVEFPNSRFSRVFGVRDVYTVHPREKTGERII